MLSQLQRTEEIDRAVGGGDEQVAALEGEGQAAEESKQVSRAALAPDCSSRSEESGG